MEAASSQNVNVPKDQINTWTEFFQDPQFTYYDKIQELANLYPEERSILVDYWDLHRFNDEFAEAFLRKPREMSPAAEKAIFELCPADAKAELHLRVFNLPAQTSRVPMPDLRSSHLEKYIALEGLVRSRSEVRPRITIGIFNCNKCNFHLTIPQEDNLLREPYICPNCEKEAGKTTFELVKTISEYVDLQMINIQETPESIQGAAPPQRMKIFVRDDLCGRVQPGERIIINGILFASQRKIANQKSTDFDLFMDAFSVEQEEVPYEEISISKDEEEEIKNLAKNSHIYELIRDSIAPGIYEMDTIKEALALQLFGGVTKDTKVSHSRGDIHILLIGDPGTGKSQLLRYIEKIAPRANFASGKSASAAGLTATAVKDELDGRWTVEGGALVLADRGLACIDEIDKMREEDRSSMHEAMEQQSISFAKAGINVTLMTRCSILAAANPVKGRFDQEKLFTEQINLMPTLLSRFDLIFPVIDKPDEEHDHRLAAQVLDSHIAGEMRRNLEEKKEADYDMEDAENIQKSQPPIERELMKKYVAYAKRNIFPVMSTEVRDYLLQYYVTTRSQGKANPDDEEKIDRISITVRQLEGLIRLSEASARVRLSNEVSVEDCQKAISLFDFYLRNIARDRSGKLDIDIIMSGTTASKRNHGKIMRQVILDLIKDPDIDTANGADMVDIKRVATREGIPEDEIEDILKKMSQAGEVYSPRAGYYKVTK